MKSNARGPVAAFFRNTAWVWKEPVMFMPYTAVLFAAGHLAYEAAMFPDKTDLRAFASRQTANTEVTHAIEQMKVTPGSLYAALDVVKPEQMSRRGKLAFEMCTGRHNPANDKEQTIACLERSLSELRQPLKPDYAFAGVAAALGLQVGSVLTAIGLGLRLGRKLPFPHIR